ncbi:MAG: BMP family ABC transporter substrate-binding protein [Anaerolineales bacterium]|nr:MAG: BMP family ABC transporter substrate-binding protein [Anaerolineales bacterium]
MKRTVLYPVLCVLMVLSMLLAACGPAQEVTEPPVEPGPQVEEPVVEEPVAEPEEPAEPVADEPCLIIGALHGGPINDAGYNQAMHESVAAIAENIPCVKIIEAENVPEEAGATATMENMISEGAKMIIATAFNHQYPALELAGKYPDVVFEHAGGWEMSGNFANFFGEPPDVWYMLGVAAGRMTETNKLGFVAAFPLGWSLTFANGFHLGARSVNPDVETIISFTFSWGESAKEAETTNALINQGVDVITMHVDSPATVISTAESRGVYSIGFQSLHAQEFAPEYWISGTGYTLGGTLTWLTSTVLDGTWEPIFLRCSLWDGCMALAPFGPNVPQEVQDEVMATSAKLEAGELVVFAGPILDQEGNVVVADGEQLTDDLMSSVDWLVQGMIGSPK